MPNIEGLTEGNEGNEARTKNSGSSAFSFASIRAIRVELLSLRTSALALRPQFRTPCRAEAKRRRTHSNALRPSASIRGLAADELRQRFQR
jgi:hypothetical protein